MANKATSKSKTNHYATYKSSKRWEANRIKRLERTLKEQPNNKQVEAALKGGLIYRRKDPKVRMWSASWIRIAKIFKEITGSFDPHIMSSNPKVSSEAMQKQGRKTKANALAKVDKSQKVDFSIGARLQGTR